MRPSRTLQPRRSRGLPAAEWRGAASTGAAARHLARTAGLVLLAATLGVFHVWTRTRVVAEGYRLASVQGEHSRLVSEHDRLRLEVEALRAPRALEEYARTKLGMAPPDPGPVWAGRALGGDDHLSGPAEPALSSPPGALALRAPSGGRAAPFGSAADRGDARGRPR